MVEAIFEDFSQDEYRKRLYEYGPIDNELYQWFRALMLLSRALFSEEDESDQDEIGRFINCNLHTTIKGDKMDGGTKGCLGIIVIFVIIALFLFWPSAPEAKGTYMEWYADAETNNGNDGRLIVLCYENNTENGSVYSDLENATVLVNVTYENGTVIKYNLTTDVSGTAEIQNLSAGQYKVSAYLVGDETHKASTYTGEFKVMEYVAPSETESYAGYDTESETSYGTHQGYTYTYRWVYI